jgi:hypothetical protein
MHDELEGMRTEGISVFLKSSVPKFAWKDWENHIKLIRLVSIRDEIRTW